MKTGSVVTDYPSSTAGRKSNAANYSARRLVVVKSGMAADGCKGWQNKVSSRYAHAEACKPGFQDGERTKVKGKF